jgi:enterochelin esterase-like enzyme
MFRPCALALFICAAAAPAPAADDYPLGPDSMVQPDVPQGTVTQHRWTSKIFSGTERDYWVYVPKQYDPAKPACLMIFQDGNLYVDVKGPVRVPTVFDNLIAPGQMPVTIAVFINPGQVPATRPGAKPRQNRSFEYDTLSDQYAHFLIDEFLPEALKEYKLADGPQHRALCGISSGGICAFTAAWERPDYFGKVLSHVGSFDNIRGGDAYPAMIRNTERKPLRVWLQDGTGDLDNLFGSWPLGHQEMVAALKYMRYDVESVLGDGGHNAKQGGATFPDALRWLWRDMIPKPEEKK